MKKGDPVKLSNGKHGVVHSVHKGTYYGVLVGTSFGYHPAAHVEPENDTPGTQSNPDPDNDNDNDMPGA